ncbi:MAG: serine protease [Pirellulales bacterium]|nr:serine protease [Pirellulales bacterium]
MTAVLMLLSGELSLWAQPPNKPVLPVPANRAVPQQLPRSTQFVGSLVVNTPQGKRTGTAFVVSPTGQIATSFSLVEGGTKAQFVLPSAKKPFDVTGVWVASQKTDLAILAIAEPGQNWEGLPLETKNWPAIGEALIPQLGPRSPAIDQQFPLLDPRPGQQKFYFPRLHRQLSGREFWAGWEKLPDTAIGRDPFLHWYALDVGIDPSGAGAPVWNRTTGQVVGILSGVTANPRELRWVTRASHLVELLAEIPAQPSPLATLKTWRDPLAPLMDLPEKNPAAPNVAAQPDAPAPNAAVVGDIFAQIRAIADPALLKRDGYLAERYAANARRIAELESQISAVEQLLPRLRDENVEARAKQDQVLTRINTMQPEQPYQSTRVVNVQDETGRIQPRQQQVTLYRFSARQNAEIARLRDEGFAQQGAVTTSELLTHVARNGDLPFLRASLAHEQRETFFLTDPLELRENEESRRLLTALDAIIDEGGAPAAVLIDRAMCHLHLRDFAAAEADLQAAIGVDTTITHVANAARARILLLTALANDAAKPSQIQAATEQLQRAYKLSAKDPRVLAIAARMDLDQEQYAPAGRKLLQLHHQGQRTLETRLALGWLLLAASSSDVNNPELAEHLARESCFGTAARDWAGLALLAAVHVKQQEHDEAERLLDAALLIAPESGTAQGEHWRFQLTRKQPLERFWK